MPRRRIYLQVFPVFRAVVRRPWLRRVAAEALAIADPGGTIGAGVVIADDETLRDLNHQFRGLDEVTDVLSFSPAEGPVLPLDLPLKEQPLGDVVVSYPQAVRQAQEHDWSVEEEVALLVVHGVLHLLGHDHAEPREEAVMKALEQSALARLFPASVPAEVTE